MIPRPVIRRAPDLYPEPAVNTSRAVLGPELVTNGTFDDGATGWNLNLWTVGGGVASENAGGSSLWQSVALVAGKTYELRGVMSGRTAGSVTPQFIGGVTVNGTAISANGAFVQRMTANALNTRIDFNANPAFIGDLDLLSLREVL